MSIGYLSALALTLVIEVPLVLWVLRRAPRRRVLVAAVVGNLATHLGIHFLLPHLGLGPVAYEVMAESTAFTVEAALYAWVLLPGSPWCGVAASALANGASYLLGLLFFG